MFVWGEGGVGTLRGANFLFFWGGGGGCQPFFLFFFGGGGGGTLRGANLFFLFSFFFLFFFFLGGGCVVFSLFLFLGVGGVFSNYFDALDAGRKKRVRPRFCRVGKLRSAREFLRARLGANDKFD